MRYRLRIMTLHLPTLGALVEVATSSKRWSSRSALASEAGFSPALLSSVLSGRKGMGEQNVRSLCDVLGVDPSCVTQPEALWDTSAVCEHIDAIAGQVTQELASLRAIARQAKGRNIA